MKTARAIEVATATTVRDAFDRLAADYDRGWTESLIGRLQRQAVWKAIDGLFQPGDRVLDLGCGTGADAARLARKGVTVHAIDVSPCMVTTAQKRIEKERLADRVTFQVLRVENLDLLDGQCFDGVLSNFGPLNCVADLEHLADCLGRMVRPGGPLALCFMGRFCLWETLWHALKGQPSKAIRRWGKKNRAPLLRLSCQSPEEGQPESEADFDVYYPSVRDIAAAFGRNFRLERVEGIGMFVPPSYLEPSVRPLPKVVRAFAEVDRAVSRWPGLRAIGDHRLCVFVRAS